MATAMKRRKGVGSLYRRKKRRPDGKIVELPTWWVKYSTSGRVIRESTRSERLDEAKSYLKARLGEVATGKFVGLRPERVRFSDLAADLIEDYERRGLASLAHLESRLTNHLIPAFGRIRAVDLSTHHIELYKERRRGQGASFSTVDRELEIVRRALRLGAESDPPRVGRVPKIRFFRVDNVRTGFLEERNYVALRDALPAPERLLLVLSYHTGMRLGLLRGLRWSWVNLPEKRITIPAGTDKNRQPRTVPIYGDMGPYLEMAATQRKTCFPDCPYVVQRHGHQVVDIRKAWSRACEAIGLDDLHFHDLRRSAVRNMDRAGVPRDVAMRIIGHKTPAMFRRYNIISDRDLDDASKKLEAYRDRERKRVEGSTDAASSLPN